MSSFYENDLAIETLIARIYEDYHLLTEEYDCTKDESAERNLERLLFAINCLRSKAEALFKAHRESDLCTKAT